MDVIHADLQPVASQWNSHPIRPYRGTACPPGIPKELYFLPENEGFSDCGIAVDMATLDSLREGCSRSQSCESAEVEDNLGFVMQETHYCLPQTAEEAVRLFVVLMNASNEK